ncbi:hypothetical protein Scel_85580 [Streptomyces cellostaticus]|nr:hypothetical protein Scel_85580 [Streptomyces cellostaticus]
MNDLASGDAASGRWCVDDSDYGLREFGCQNQNGPYAGFQRFRLSWHGAVRTATEVRPPTVRIPRRWAASPVGSVTAVYPPP